MKKLVLAVALLGVASVVILAPFVAIPLRLHFNGKLQDELPGDLREQYPAAQFKGFTAYDRPRVYLHVRGVSDPSVRDDILNWVASWKASRGTRVEFWLLFFSEDERDDPPPFQI
jgi:hypothetical protein